MPTYINSSGSDKVLTGPRGERLPVAAGATIETSFFTDDSNFTKTLNTPLSNRATATTSVSLTTSAQDHTLNGDTRIFIITQIVGAVTVRPQVDTAVPILLAWTSEDPIIVFNMDDYPCDTLRLTGASASDTCTVMEYAY